MGLFGAFFFRFRLYNSFRYDKKSVRDSCDAKTETMTQQTAITMLDVSRFQRRTHLSRLTLVNLFESFVETL